MMDSAEHSIQDFGDSKGQRHYSLHIMPCTAQNRVICTVRFAGEQANDAAFQNLSRGEKCTDRKTF